MKRLLCVALLFVCVVAAQVWGQEAPNFDALLAAGKAQQAAGKFAEARAEYEKALAIKDITNADKSVTTLQVALSYYEEGDYERAKPAFEKVLKTPVANAPPFREDGMGNYILSPARAAKLYLLTMAPPEERKQTRAVLFIGSSMTYRGYMPLLVEELAASAPPDRPRVLIGMYVRMGTGFDKFWNDGDTRDTARGMISAAPWDAAVMETFYSRTREDQLKYGQLFADFARGKNIKSVFYESHPAQSLGYPDDSLKYHENIAELGKIAKAAVAPVLLAEMRYLETVPDAKREEFYADGVHPSEKGQYISACCIYSAVTGFSPAGLYHPDNISHDDAKAMQEAAWKAVQETNPDLKLVQ